MEDPHTDSQGIPEAIEKLETQKPHEVLLPTPPETDDGASNTSSDSDVVDIPLPPSSTRPTQVLDVDLKTPDAHVARDPRLIRLTGVHPFNVEAPLQMLMQSVSGPYVSLSYVMNGRR